MGMRAGTRRMGALRTGMCWTGALRTSVGTGGVHFVWKITDENNIQGGVIMKLSLRLDLGRWEGEIVAATSAARRRRPTSARERDPGQSYASTAIDLPWHSVGGAAGVKVVVALP